MYTHWRACGGRGVLVYSLRLPRSAPPCCTHARTHARTNDKRNPSLVVVWNVRIACYLFCPNCLSLCIYSSSHFHLTDCVNLFSMSKINLFFDVETLQKKILKIFSFFLIQGFTFLIMACMLFLVGRFIFNRSTGRNFLPRIFEKSVIENQASQLRRLRSYDHD